MSIPLLFQTYLITLIHYMGGSIRKDMSSKVTHLIAASATGDKYRYAAGFGLPVLARSWVDACWERRDNPACIATDEAFIVRIKIIWHLTDVLDIVNKTFNIRSCDSHEIYFFIYILQKLHILYN